MDTRVLRRGATLLCFFVLFQQVTSQDEYQRIRKVCNYDSDCLANAFCREQSYCQCKKDFIYYATGSRNFSCLQEASVLGDPCEADIQCTKPFGNQAVCLINSAGFGACRCVGGAHFQDGRCYETSVIGGKCKVNNNCYLASGLPTYCLKSVCVCPNNYHPHNSGSDCVKSVYLDQPCENDQECVTENSRCGDVCRCRVNYIQGRQNNTCLKSADYIGDPCEEEEQCTMFLVRATCSEGGVCTCLPGFHHTPPNSKCFRDIGLGEMCEENSECVVTSTECSGGTCRCEPGLNPSEDNNQCIGINGQEPSESSFGLLLMSVILLRLCQYFRLSTYVI